MKIAVVGAGGFIGSHCVEHFTAQDHQVIELGRADVADAEIKTVFEGQDIDYCINAAGSALVSRSLEHPDDDFRDNVGLVSNLLSTIATTSPQTRFLQLSSAAVYGNPDRQPINETTPLAPVSPYGYHKVLSEQLIQEYRDLYDVGGASLRIFSAYGEGLKRQLFWDIHQKAKASDKVELLGTGQESRDFIYIKDVVRAIGVVIAWADFEGEAYNVANGREVSIKEAAQTFLEQSGWNGRLAFTQQSHEGHPANWQADISKIEELGYVQEYSFVRGIRNYCQWLENLSV